MLNLASYQVAMQELTQKFYAESERLPLMSWITSRDNAIQGAPKLRVAYTSDIDEYTHTAAESWKTSTKSPEDIRNGQKH